MKKPNISVMMHTASYDDFLTSQGIPSYFEAVTENLARQTFNSFEFIYVDTFYEENKDKFAALKRPFQIKHVPVHPDHRYYFDKGYVYISAAKNTGILYADGTLCITVDDSEFFPDHLLGLYWRHYESGCFMNAVHKRMKSIVTSEGKIQYPIQGEIYINDHRVGQTQDGVKCHKHGSWMYAGTSFALQDALTLNGFNERMDGCKSLEDCDFGGRLALLGRQFAMEYEGHLYILDHASYCDIQLGDEMKGVMDGQLHEVKAKIKRKPITNLIAVENYGTLRCAPELFDIVANRGKLTQKHFEIIQRETLRYRGFDPLAPANEENLAIWLGVPTFDLKVQREELRKSKDWKW